MYTHIVGLGTAFPAKRVTNDELSVLFNLDTSDEWIESHTGIRSRNLASDQDSASSLGARAALVALEEAGVAPEELGMIVVATSTPDNLSFPSVACLIQEKIGAKNAGAFDISAACPGFMYALQIARGLMHLDNRPVLVVAAEVMSRIIDWSDRNTCVLFGDAGAAAVLKNSEEPGGLRTYKLGADGSGSEAIYRHGNRTGEVAGPLTMNGRVVYNFAVKTMSNTVLQILEEAGLTLDDLKYIVPHQANNRILEGSARRLGVGIDKIYSNIAEMANTSACSIPIALKQMQKEGRLQKGDKLILVSFGAGLTYGGVFLEWSL